MVVRCSGDTMFQCSALWNCLRLLVKAFFFKTFLLKEGTVLSQRQSYRKWRGGGGVERRGGATQIRLVLPTSLSMVCMLYLDTRQELVNLPEDYPKDVGCNDRDVGRLQVLGDD